MANTTEVVAAAVCDHPAGTLTSSRWSVLATVPVPSGNRPITRSPTAKDPLFKLVSITTPQASTPMTASGSGYRPSAIMTSRKLAAIADTATRTCPGPSGASASGISSSRRFSKVPAVLIANRHGRSLGGTNSPPTARLPCTRAV
ncbi:Uncharacterised protein [Mycobacterium tuberculosis]|uniref:Uncharacterized protein n=1 Tax=Mycobacterium tuberculosis TaxID=1773 RepID=A0A655AFH4_MYCTX|nr:Uncharacterised protein [Mycobacterium tuberculosis]CEZ71596.1 Uncharacterised protein [Mycobacterium tuberculosis]CFA20671.1 Uncharacterised protein [Mycobacterium tuberculosis]CFH16025.1 Uncharacterised protein [Mycobacterium tuberculosis]CFS25823.1 Uncharacterised protein [Mycobacterium tuberculosis]